MDRTEIVSWFWSFQYCSPHLLTALFSNHSKLTIVGRKQLCYNPHILLQCHTITQLPFVIYTTNLTTNRINGECGSENASGSPIMSHLTMAIHLQWK